MKREEILDKCENIIYADFECYIDENGKHIPNLAVAMYNNSNKFMIFENNGHSIQDKFCSWLFSLEHKKSTVIFHNMKGYDGYFLMNYFVKNGLNFHPIYSGLKLMYLNIDSLKIR